MSAETDAILDVVRAIPAGSVATYGQVAELAGLPRRARLVGRTLAALPPASDVPWHRVVKAGGLIAFPEASPAFARQAERLAAEGIPVAAGRVDLPRCRWSLDALLWGPGALS